MARLIENYGMLADLKTAALVGIDGSVDWLCAPRFDSDACFSALLGYEEHGQWAIRPTAAVTARKQRYLEDTLVLQTDVACDGGAYRITEFMRPELKRTELIRIVEGLEGSVELEMVLAPRFGYGARMPWISQEEHSVSLLAGPDALGLRSSVPVQLGDTSVSALFTLTKGQVQTFSLVWHSSNEDAPRVGDARRAQDEAIRYWRDWAEKCTYEGKWRDAVVRSLLTLKALTYEPTGGVVAAPTTSLPEEIGGVRNWDYRFCWLRDATLTLTALMIGGYVEEAESWRDWLMRAVAGDPSQVQIMYGLSGERRLTETELSWLPGYEGSKPVRIGNAASGQFQLDVYGEVMRCVYLTRKMGVPAADRSYWPQVKTLLSFILSAWQLPDDGIWEVRGGRKHFTHSQMMAWAAVDSVIKLVEEFPGGQEDLRDQLGHMRSVRERIREDILQRGFNTAIGAFTQSFGSEALDASVLLMPHMGFLPADDPRMVGTVKAIEKELVRDGFVARYSTTLGLDGLPGSEGAFLACSYWLADNYAFQGRIDEANALFERLLSIRSPLGLLAEEYEPKLKRQVGNFPQGFSHLALIYTADAITKAEAGLRGAPSFVS